MYNFTVNWFDQVQPLWQKLIINMKPTSYLEIGSFEGKSASYFIQEASQFVEHLEVHCVDTWMGSVEHVDMDMAQVEERFNNNLQIAVDNAKCKTLLSKYKGRSSKVLPHLICNNHLYDLIYIDGSHMAPDVLVDACMAFGLLKVNGVMIFDDYRFTDQETIDSVSDKMHHPRPAIDTFCTIFRNKVGIIDFYEKDLIIPDMYQRYIQKISE